MKTVLDHIKDEVVSMGRELHWTEVVELISNYENKHRFEIEAAYNTGVCNSSIKQLRLITSNNYYEKKYGGSDLQLAERWV
jgi:hypothetical protein